MPIYEGTAIKNVFDLINRDNPDLPFEVSPTTFIVGVPVAIALTPQKHDTQIRLVARTSSMYRGALTLTYRRLALPSLFREVKPIIERFLLSRWYSLTEFLPLINSQYGLNFSVVDFNDTAGIMHGSYQPSRDFTITARVDSLMYSGAVVMNWRQGKEELGKDIMTVPELAGAVWPGGNDFVAVDDRRAYGTWLFWNRHFTEEAIAGAWANSLSTSTSSSSASYPQTKLYTDAFIDQDLEINFGVWHETDNPKGIGARTLYIRTVALPDPLYPELNRTGFSFATVMYPSDAALYAKYGRAVMYFNK